MPIVTITVNPALDKSTTVARIVADQKLQCNSPRYDPGGGGVNVARVIKRLGGESSAIFQSSGSAGIMIEQLLEKEEVNCIPYPTKEWTRENLVVTDESTGQQYRFGMPGPNYTSQEQKTIFSILEALTAPPDYLVISGRLAPGLPADFYGEICKWASKKNIKVALDSSGNPLKIAVEKGVFLVKPNLKELAELAGSDSINNEEQEQLAKRLVDNGNAKIVVVSLGPRGAMMVSPKGIDYAAPPTVMSKSTVGAGDSMVAGIMWALYNHFSQADVLRYGVACGTATTMNEGTELCLQKDVEDLFRWLKNQHPYNK